MDINSTGRVADNCAAELSITGVLITTVWRKGTDCFSGYGLLANSVCVVTRNMLLSKYGALFPRIILHNSAFPAVTMSRIVGRQ